MERPKFTREFKPDSRGGFYAWLTRPRGQRSRSDEELGVKMRASFLASDRTYDARRVWRDLLTEGMSCGLHRIERLMRLQALKARPRRRRQRRRRSGNVWDNAAMESFFVPQTERTAHKLYCTRDEAKEDVFDYSFEVDDLLISGRLPDWWSASRCCAHRGLQKAVEWRCPIGAVIAGRAQTVHSAQRGRAKGVRPPDGVDEP
jgi:transposase InsO family protein